MNKEEALKNLENHVTDLIGKFIESCTRAELLGVPEGRLEQES